MGLLLLPILLGASRSQYFTVAFINRSTVIRKKMQLDVEESTPASDMTN